MTADGRPGAGPHRADTWVGAHEAICAYLDAVDGADLDRLVDLLEHATVVLPSGRITGGRAVREAYGPLLSRPGADGRRRTKHHLTNVVVSGPDEDGLLTAEAYYFVGRRSTATDPATARATDREARATGAATATAGRCR